MFEPDRSTTSCRPGTNGKTFSVRAPMSAFTAEAVARSTPDPNRTRSWFATYADRAGVAGRSLPAAVEAGARIRAPTSNTAGTMDGTAVRARCVRPDVVP